MIRWRKAWALGLLVALGCAGAPGTGSRNAPTAAVPTRLEGAAAPSDPAGAAWVYVGMAGGEIALFHLDAATGRLTRRGGGTAPRAPSTLLRSADRGALVAVDATTGQASAFSIDAKSGALKLVARAPTGGGAAAGATLDESGRYVLSAHPTAGKVSVLAITQLGGLKAITTFPVGSGARAVAVHRDQVAFVSNFRDGTVSQYRFNIGTGMLTPMLDAKLDLPAGFAPTRLACHPSGRWVYLLDERLDSVAVFAFDTDLKALSPISSQIIPTLPGGSAGGRGRGGPVALAVSPNGRFLYVTNRGPNDVATLAIDAAGTLALVAHLPGGSGGALGALAVDPSGRILIVANEGGKSLGIHAIEPTTGALENRHIVALPAAPLSVLVVRP